jgi:hypothetical protein
MQTGSALDPVSRRGLPQHVDPAGVIVAGESCGAVLTLTTSLQLCRDGADIARLLPARPSSCPTPRPGGHT